MSAFSTDTKIRQRDENRAPYPSWSAIADGIGAGRLAAEQDRQALKEARIWRALADEGSPGGSVAQSGSQAPRGAASPAQNADATLVAMHHKR